MRGALSVDELAERVIAADVAAVGRAISVVEDRRPAAEPVTIALLRAISRRRNPAACARVGITGPPGVGKSSLVSAVAREARRRGRTVGVLAVDPSSPRSGGALLGDRARIEIDPEDLGFFVRSMASGGELGGLASAAGAAVDVLSAAYDLVLVETTGVGQSETDVEHIADSVVMVIQPASGDMLQFLKAGIIEIPDVFAINKCDLGNVAQRAGAELAAALAAVHGPSGQPSPPVVHTSTLTHVGIEELLNALDVQHRALQDGGRIQDRREAAAAQWAMRLFMLRYGDFGIARAGGRRRLLGELRGLIRRGATAVEAVATARPEFAK